jgi:two-component system, chemotaxis family, response regulator Rcp1
MHAFSRPIEVLLIDDSAADVRLTQEAFKEWHVSNHLNVVMDGVSALDFLHHEGAYRDAPRPDLVLLDLNLPGKNGPEVLEEIKSDPDLRRIPVMILSTSHEDSDLHRAYDLHANCYIAKPLGLDDFLTVVRSIEQFWLSGVVSLPRD